MKKLLLTLTTCTGLLTAQAQGVYQIPNSNFESWAADNEPGNGWNSFASARTEDLGSLAGLATMFSPHPAKVEGYNSASAVRLYSGTMNANGNLTTGKINMGSTTPANAANYNFTDLEDETHSLLFAGTPDSVAFFAKFKSGGSENGRGQFILHDEYRYCDPETSNEEGYEAHKVALAAVHVPECEEWTRFAAAFEYTGMEKPGKQYMLASFTTNPVPGGSTKDTLIVDSVVMIYNSELASLTYDGQDIFAQGQTAFEVATAYDESKLACTANGRAATIETAYDENTKVLTITVKGDDWSETNLNQHVYTVAFEVPMPVTSYYTNSLLVNVNGSCPSPTEETIQLIEETDGSYSFLLPNFSFSGMSLGDIRMTELNRTETEEGINYQQTQTITLNLYGQPMPLEVTLDATEKDGEMTANIYIPFMGMMDIYVTFAPALTLDSETDAAGTEGLHNITFSRTFPAGWSTLSLPFSTTQSNLGAKEVQTFSTFADNTLEFTVVDANQPVEGNTPYMVYFENETEVTLHGAASDYAPKTVTAGDVSFTGNYTAGKDMADAYVLAETNGIYSIVKAEAGSTLGCTEAYFNVNGESAQADRLAIQFEGHQSVGVENVKASAADEPFDVYTLSGVKVRENATNLNGLQRGIYIVNGKKVTVK